MTGIRNIENEYNAKVNNALLIEMLRHQSQWANHFRDISHRYVRRNLEHEITVMQIPEETIMSTSDEYCHITDIYRIGIRLWASKFPSAMKNRFFVLYVYDLLSFIYRKSQI